MPARAINSLFIIYGWRQTNNEIVDGVLRLQKINIMSMSMLRVNQSAASQLIIWAIMTK